MAEFGDTHDYYFSDSDQTIFFLQHEVISIAAPGTTDLETAPKAAGFSYLAMRFLIVVGVVLAGIPDLKAFFHGIVWQELHLIAFESSDNAAIGFKSLTKFVECLGLPKRRA
ncbi:hypothetical protein B0H14DRAFT_2632851 [Mycena olivaceomarginata]|nr:hypothetical protein B0H14DRAFT_2632851 [Mycena olivaceomarginata]